MSVKQRVLLQLACEALDDAGIGYGDDSSPQAPSRQRVGVFVCGGSLPHLNGLDEMRSSAPDAYFAAEVAHDEDYCASTIAYHLILTGPAEVVQTACSSSLVAVVRSVHTLRLGLCDVALCGVALCGGASFSPNDAIARPNDPSRA